MSFPNKDYKKGSVSTKTIVKKNGAGVWIILSIGLISVIWAFTGFKGFGGKTYKSNIAGMSDSQYAQCIKLGSEVMEAQDDAYPDNSVRSSSDSNIRRYGKKQDEWTRSCSLQALEKMGVDFNAKTFPPTSPLDWAKLE